MFSDIEHLLTDPDSFFADREPTLAEPAAVVLLLVVVAAASTAMGLAGWIGSMPADLRGGLVGGAIVGVVISAIQSVVSWVLVTAVFLVVTRFFGGEGSFRDLLAFVGWGYVPQVIGAVLSLAVAPFTLQGAALVGLLFYLWSAYIWVFAVKRGRNVSSGAAAIAVLVPLAVVVLLGGIGIVGMTGL